ncbi:hypothetical protein JOB18_024679 [Solea senegalensis]|uniref:Uncharacterized protein n=1 Tax=Solea senegalensis TaxID=28829 RepID=A0AAV6PFN1_SOLSE|nr:hypothetical protein JOB18_024679 [Solea senegalensis]
MMDVSQPTQEVTSGTQDDVCNTENGLKADVEPSKDEEEPAKHKEEPQGTGRESDQMQDSNEEGEEPAAAESESQEEKEELPMMECESNQMQNTSEEGEEPISSAKLIRKVIYKVRAPTHEGEELKYVSDFIPNIVYDLYEEAGSASYQTQSVKVKPLSYMREEPVAAGSGSYQTQSGKVEPLKYTWVEPVVSGSGRYQTQGVKIEPVKYKCEESVATGSGSDQTQGVKIEPVKYKWEESVATGSDGDQTQGVKIEPPVKYKWEESVATGSGSDQTQGVKIEPVKYKWEESVATGSGSDQIVEHVINCKEEPEVTGDENNQTPNGNVKHEGEEPETSESEALICDIMKTIEDFGNMKLCLPDLSSFDDSPDITQEEEKEDEEEEPKIRVTWRYRVTGNESNVSIKAPIHEKKEEPLTTGSESSQIENTNIKPKHEEEHKYMWEGPVATGCDSNRMQKTKIIKTLKHEDELRYTAKLISKVMYTKREGPQTTGSESSQTQISNIKTLNPEEKTYVSTFVPEIVYDLYGEAGSDSGQRQLQSVNKIPRKNVWEESMASGSVSKQQRQLCGWKEKELKHLRYEKEEPLTMKHLRYEKEEPLTMKHLSYEKEEPLTMKHLSYKKEEPLTMKHSRQEKKEEAAKMKPAIHMEVDQPKSSGSGGEGAGHFRFDDRLTALTCDIVNTIDDFCNMKLSFPDLSCFDSSPDGSQEEEPKADVTWSLGKATGSDSNTIIKVPMYERREEALSTGSVRYQTQNVFQRVPKHVRVVEPVVAGSERKLIQSVRIKAPKHVQEEEEGEGDKGEKEVEKEEEDKEEEEEEEEVVVEPLLQLHQIHFQRLRGQHRHPIAYIGVLYVIVNMWLGLGTLDEVNAEYGLSHERVVATVTDNGSSFVKAFKELNISAVCVDEESQNDGEDLSFIAIEENETGIIYQLICDARAIL